MVEIRNSKTKKRGKRCFWWGRGEGRCLSFHLQRRVEVIKNFAPEGNQATVEERGKTRTSTPPTREGVYRRTTLYTYVRSIWGGEKGLMQIDRWSDSERPQRGPRERDRDSPRKKNAVLFVVSSSMKRGKKRNGVQSGRDGGNNSSSNQAGAVKYSITGKKRNSPSHSHYTKPGIVGRGEKPHSSRLVKARSRIGGGKERTPLSIQITREKKKCSSYYRKKKSGGRGSVLTKRGEKGGRGPNRAGLFNPGE